MKPQISRNTPFLLTALVLVLTAVLALPATAADMAEDAAQKTQRIDLPSLSTVTPYPYTIAVPLTWEPRREIPAAGVFLGPPGSMPDNDDTMIFVRHSTVDVSDPQKVLDAIKANDPAQPWSAKELKVIDAGGRKAAWILMELPPQKDNGARRTLTVKLPVADGSVDVMATAPVDQFDALRPEFERILRSIQPVAADEGSKDAMASDDGGAK